MNNKFLLNHVLIVFIILILWKDPFTVNKIISKWLLKNSTCQGSGAVSILCNHMYTLDDKELNYNNAFCPSYRSQIRLWKKSFNSLWPSDAIWWHGSGLTMAKVVACWWPQAITWANVDFSLLISSGIHLRAISRWAHNLLLCMKSLKIIYQTWSPHFPGPMS